MAQLSEVKIQGQTADHVDRRCEAPKANNSQNALTLNVSDLSDTPMCRICYNGSSRERLLKPCKCKGSIKNVHRSCLERWLESSNTDACELCNHRFATKRTHKSCWQWCRQPETRRDRRNLFGDCASFLFLTPLFVTCFWLCTEGAVYLQRVRRSTLETVALSILAFFLVLAYVTWITLNTRYHLIIWSRWRSRNYNVRIVDHLSGASSTSSGSEMETINLSEPPATNNRLPFIAQPLPLRMDGTPKCTVPFTRRPQTDLSQRNLTLNPDAARRPQTDELHRNLAINPHAKRCPQTDEPQRGLTLNPDSSRRLQMIELQRNPTLNPYATLRPQTYYPWRNLTLHPYATRPPQTDDPWTNLILHLYATRHLQVLGPLRSPTVNPHANIRPFSVDEPEKIPTASV